MCGAILKSRNYKKSKFCSTLLPPQASLQKISDIEKTTRPNRKFNHRVKYDERIKTTGVLLSVGRMQLLYTRIPPDSLISYMSKNFQPALCISYLNTEIILFIEYASLPHHRFVSASPSAAVACPFPSPVYDCSKCCARWR